MYCSCMCIGVPVCMNVSHVVFFYIYQKSFCINLNNCGFIDPYEYDYHDIYPLNTVYIIVMYIFKLINYTPMQIVNHYCENVIVIISTIYSYDMR